MADLNRATDGPSPLSAEGYDESLLPDFHREFISEEDINAFATALTAPEPSPSTDDLTAYAQQNGRGPRGSFDSGRLSTSKSPNATRRGSQASLFITAQNDWAPVHPSKPRKKGDKRRKIGSRRTRDETREGYLYTLLKWPLLIMVGAWVIGLGLLYLMTRLYIWLYGEFELCFFKILCDQSQAWFANVDMKKNISWPGEAKESG